MAHNSETVLQRKSLVPHWRKWIHRFVPANFHNVLGLTWRLIWRGKAAGRYAITYSLMGLLLTPLDLILQFFERRLYRSARPARMPLIFVCGAPRSGTTVAAQCLIKHLPVFYFSNLTSLFPRSPIMASKLFGWLARTRQRALPLKSFYGRTSHLSHPNDALYIWDRWVGTDRYVVPDSIDASQQRDMVQFFSAVEEFSGKATVNKNNSLNTYAHLVAEILPNAVFICLDRDPKYLAQSHYVARKFIHGNTEIPYGIRGGGTTGNPLDDICQQIVFHRRCIEQQQDLIGSDRFIVMPYEGFCQRPSYWVSMLAKRILNITLDLKELEKRLPPMPSANYPKIEESILTSIEQKLAQIMDEK